MGTASPWFAGTRLGSLALIALVAVPLLCITTYSYVRERDEARTSAQARALNIAILAQHEYQLTVSAAQQFTTPGLPFTGAEAFAATVADPKRCNAKLADLLKQTTGYLNLFEADVQGNLFCSATPLPAPVSIADRDYFQEVMRTLKPAVGAPIIGRVTFRPTVVVAHPIIDDFGKAIGLAAVSIDFSTVVVLPEALELPPASSVTILGRDGIVMARNTEADKWIGKPGPALVGLPAATATGSRSTAVGRGSDGVARLYGIVPLHPTPDGPVQGTLLVGIPTETAYGVADAAFRRNLFWLAVVCAVATAAAWFGSERFVIAPLHAITAAMQRIAGGAFETRTHLAGAGGEIGTLAAAVDSMAEQLATTQLERDRDRQEMATILSTATSVVAVVGEGGTVTRVNRAIDTMFGWSVEEFTGRDINMLFDEPVLPGRRLAGPRLVETRGHRRDGTTFPLEVDVREVEGSAGQRYIAVLRDLTERRRMEAEREMGRIAAARAEFLRTLSHELRSPLTAVLGFAQLLRGDSQDARTRRQAQDIEDAGRHMLALVNDLLDLARIDAGRWDIDISDVNATELLDGIVEGVRARATERGLRVGVTTVPATAFVRTDARILREVATNLIENAVKYTERGAVGVRGEFEGDTFVLSVSDTGVGIPADRLESIFNEFEQLSPAGTQQGSGLGLAITRKLVALVDGTVSVVSTPGAGSVFTVRIPVKVPASA